MPVHDWTRVSAGTFHAFHSAWIVHLQETLNGGLLPSNYYALAEQRAADVLPDVLTLEQIPEGQDPFAAAESGWQGTIAVAERPPKVQIITTAESAFVLAKQRSLVIRHATGDTIVALVEIVSAANKSSRGALTAFVDKAIAALQHGHHLLIADLFSHGRHDAAGIHGAIWGEFDGTEYCPPENQPLTLAAYAAGERPTAYIQPLAVGAELPDMPLFLTPDRYIDVPLEQTYQAAWQGMPQRWRNVVEGAI